MQRLMSSEPPVDAASRLAAAAAEVPLLSKLPAATRQRLLAASRIERFAPRAELFRDGEIPAHLHIHFDQVRAELVSKLDRRPGVFGQIRLHAAMRLN